MVKRKLAGAETKPGGLSYLALVGALVFALFPIYWMGMTSIKPLPEWTASPPVWITSNPTAINYEILFTPTGLVGTEFGFAFEQFEPAQRAILDSAITAGLGTILAITVGLLAAIGVSRHRIGGNFMPMFILSARMVPPVVAMIPLVILYSNIGLIDTHLGLILAYGLFTAPYSLWMIKSFIDDIPKELEERAQVDGLSTLGAHFKVTVPLIKGGVAATALFLLILNWSEFLLALTLTHGGVLTIPRQASLYFLGVSGVLYGPQSAIGLVATVPLFVFAFVIQRYLVRGLTFGAIKR
ncbi:MAG: carbohydrate ABC transporter permease [Candidatus Bathyarchaeia archaeon]